MNDPGKSHRRRITLKNIVRMFPDEASAREWFEAIRWPRSRACPKCGSTRTAPMRYRVLNLAENYF